MKSNPPRWAQSLLRAILAERDRDTVSGDLLEEYEEARLPSHGAFRAKLWYLRQVISLISIRGLWRAAQDPAWSSAILWTAPVAFVEFFFVFVLPDRFGVPLESSAFALTACAVGAGAASALGLASRRILAPACYWGVLLFAVIASARMLPMSVIPIFALTLASICIAVGFERALHFGIVRTGTLTIIIASAFAIVLVEIAGMLSAALGGPPEVHPPMPNLFMLCPISSLFGTLGAFAGKGVAAVLRNHGLR